VSVLRWLKPMLGQAEAKRLLAECAQSVQTVQRLTRGEGSQLNIGYDANIYHDLLPATLGAFQKACPRTAPNLFDMTPAEQYHALDERKIDLGFVRFRAHPAGNDLQAAICVGKLVSPREFCNTLTESPPSLVSSQPDWGSPCFGSRSRDSLTKA
jgi:DNA-binding transcriptional LysR family regulator